MQCSQSGVSRCGVCVDPLTGVWGDVDPRARVRARDLDELLSSAKQSTYALPWPRSAMPRNHPFGQQMGEFLCELRNQRGLTQSDLAGLLDTTQGAVSKLECGRHLPSIGMLIRIAEATDTRLVLQAALPHAAVLRDHVDLWPVAELHRRPRRGPAGLGRS